MFVGKVGQGYEKVLLGSGFIKVGIVKRFGSSVLTAAICLLMVGAISCVRTSVPKDVRNANRPEKTIRIEDAVQLALQKARKAGVLRGRDFELTAGHGVHHCWVVKIVCLPVVADAEIMIYVDSVGNVEGDWEDPNLPRQQ